MSLLSWLRGEEILDDPPEQEILGVYIAGPGVLDPRSQTWMFIRNWALEELQKTREKNDNINRDLAQTSVLRGQIKILKDLISLPNPKVVKGLLEDDE
jgi:hypothetical protein